MKGLAGSGALEHGICMDKGSIADWLVLKDHFWDQVTLGILFGPLFCASMTAQYKGQC